MKKVQLLTLVAALALGGGSVFAATASFNKPSEAQKEVSQDIEIQLDTQDEDFLKSFEAGDVTVLVEDDASVDFSIQADSEELQKAIEAGEVNIFVEGDEGMNIESAAVTKVTTKDGIQIETTDAELAKAIEAGEVVVNIEE